MEEQRVQNRGEQIAEQVLVSILSPVSTVEQKEYGGLQDEIRLEAPQIDFEKCGIANSSIGQLLEEKLTVLLHVQLEEVNLN